MFAHEFGNDTFNDLRNFRHHGGGRMGRGTMEPLILRVLLDKPMHGYEIISTLEEQSHGFWRPSPGSIYPTLQLLEEKGHVTVDEQSGKKVYALTTEGKREAQKTDKVNEHWTNSWQSKKQSFKDIRWLRESLGSIMRDIRTITHSGTDIQRKHMEEIIENLRQELHTTAKGDK